KNVNELLELTEDLQRYSLGGFDNLQINSTVGRRYGTIYGTKFATVEDPNSPHYGKRIVNGDGLPLAASGTHLLGDQSARALLGINNRSEEHTSELQSRENLVCRLLLEKKKKNR